MARKMKDTGYKFKILAYLLTGQSLTRVEGMNLGFGMDLTTRISELKSLGVSINDKLINKKTMQKRYWMDAQQIKDYRQSTSIKIKIKEIQ